MSSTHDWPRATAQEAGFVRDPGDALDRLIEQEQVADLHGVVIIRHGRLVTERYLAGDDEHWGDPLGRVDFDADTLHDLRSVSKSIVALLYGIALAEGRVPAVDTPLAEAFPGRVASGSSGGQRAATVEDALTMRLGIEWDEDLPYSDPRNSEVAMERSGDRIGFVLERPRVEPPGSRWQYCGGATALVAELIREGTGESLLDHARRTLFEPLGISAVHWTLGQDGIEVPASGLRMRPRDLARIGQLVLDGGRRGERQVVPGDWLEACLGHHARVDDDLDYGYQWWLARRWNWVAGFGNGGQRLMVLPRAGVVLVVTAGRYNDAGAWRLPVRIVEEALVPALGG